ncbi:UDP-N-acetylmuramyl peptide synthase [Legionella taurinensis]|uniref:UDP-N-acetylmuramyl peptide synthase n=2 Tax=Legionella taurinensis TaxID=70611 RepID=A0A3A5LNR9_9GAMM|nr:UDP-N-acetylmuramyl peptide synthase [Legionella taurinensis]MDX1837157.1 UDP-N-acetylmuramyl peptide synthase [Legionella taurinensis]PUT40366.1 UDP-N-acetylmuramyl peptide synthase [Legionella taurinensis]PUT40543.1 UDP-N-acetylmuramyl peptide synthase [Legionella taurinensis]PUT42788.1 UDP-N-acetylmuramyl peptide synthase [Legionella taurinensis]PUT48427.1 UDP-N-acetylmuramyl peptide synthase [Legionella taurinensis]
MNQDSPTRLHGPGVSGMVGGSSIANQAMIMDKNIRIYAETAEALGLPAVFQPELNILNIKLSRRCYYFHAAITPFNQGASIYIAKHKYLANYLLDRAGFPVPKAALFLAKHFSKAILCQKIEHFRFPLVAKPAQDTVRGRDVFCNIKDVDTLYAYLDEQLNTHKSMQVEEFHQGLKEYRVLVFKRRVIGVVERFGARVTGDGRQTLAQLIDASNAAREKLSDKLTISPLVVDQEYRQCLTEQGLTLESIPAAGQTVHLCHTVNTGRGGDIVSHGKKIHPRNARLLVKAAKTLGLQFVGFDVLCEDINQSFDHTRWLILEGNFNPNITIHEIPHRGTPSPVTRILLLDLIKRHPLAYLAALSRKKYVGIGIKFTLIVSLILLLEQLAKRI